MPTSVLYGAAMLFLAIMVAIVGVAVANRSSGAVRDLRRAATVLVTTSVLIAAVVDPFGLALQAAPPVMAVAVVVPPAVFGILFFLLAPIMGEIPRRKNR